MVKIKEYIESGVLELYVMGSASEAETSELLYLKNKYPEIQEALWNLETDLESIAQHFAIAPPPGTLAKIEARINELIRISQQEDLVVNNPFKNNGSYSNAPKESQLIDLESQPSHMRILKVWGWAFLAVFLLGLMFLAAAVYFYHQNNQTQLQLEKLRIEQKEGLH